LPHQHHLCADIFWNKFLKVMKLKQLITAAAIAAAVLFSIHCSQERDIREPGFLVAKTADQDPSIPSINVNGAIFHAEAFGHPDSAIVVCLHGGPGADYGYLLNCKDLVEQGYRVVFYDQRGTGLSQRFSTAYYRDQGLGALEEYYADLTAVIQHYRTKPTQKVFLLGHSWGGMLATAYAAKNPDAVQGLIAMEPGGLKWDDVVTYITDSRAFSLWGEAINNAAYLEQFISAGADEHEVWDYKYAVLGSGGNEITQEFPDESISWRAGAIVNRAFFDLGTTYEPDLSEGIQNFQPPVLFFYSELNKAYPKEWAEKITSAYKAVEIIKVTGVGHSGIVTDAQQWRNVTLPKIVDYLNAR
jgi:proline iminopeptidase